MNTRIIETWYAPLKNVAAFNIDGVRLTKVKHKGGGGIHGGGYEDSATLINKAWEENILYIDGAVWMSDAPHNSLTINEDVAMIRGESVLLGGLGLGLHIRELIRAGYSGRVVVAERDLRVVDAIMPTIENLWMLDLEIHYMDFWELCRMRRMQFDCIHWDCYPGGAEYRVAVKAMLRLKEMKYEYESDCSIILHGAPSLNILNLLNFVS